jgi:hypothetical protein
MFVKKKTLKAKKVFQMISGKILLGDFYAGTAALA